MLQLKIFESSEGFRGSFRKWLCGHPPPKPRDAGLEAFIATGREWQKKLASDNWIAVHWPKEFGGRSLSLVEEAIVQEELVRVDSPQLLGLFGLTMVGPVLIEHGTAKQKERYLKSILSGEEIWCQGFSEPGAGSDLAAIKTRATSVEGGYAISGQKIWTSFAHIADWCFVLCRTSSTGKKHEGLTYMLVDMKQKGVSTRPLRQISGDDEFNEVFFDDAFVPEHQVVGEVGEGWKIAISTLMYERVILTFARQLQSEVALREMVKTLASQHGHHRGEVLKARLASAVANAAALRALAYEHLLDYSGGKTPGPEGSLDKLLWSESFGEVSKLGIELRGAMSAFGAEEGEAASDVHRYLYSRGRTIAAGSSEIQRNIIAERVLGLPRLKYSFKE